MKMKVVYLDQNAASFLAKPNAKPIWREIRYALADGFHNRKLICPLPFECVMESAPKPLEFRQAIQALFWELSQGVAFKEYTEISSELTLALVRPTLEWSPMIFWKPIWAEMESAAQKVKSNWQAGKERMNERMNGFVRSQNLELMTERELLRVVAAQRSIRICDDLSSLLAGRANEESLNCRWLIEFLVSANLAPAEIEDLKRAIYDHEWANIPIHAFDILLSAKWEYDDIRGGSAAYHPNDEIDRKRAATALSHADLFITEGDMANLCQKANVNEFCQTLVLSVRDPEKVLETIRSVSAA